jgi:two-component system, NarL family, response regulator NreC
MAMAAERPARTTPAENDAARQETAMTRSPLSAAADPDGNSSVVAQPIRVVLADDHEFVLRSLRMLLDGKSEVVVVAEATDIAAVRSHVRNHRPSVLVLDVSMPTGSVLSAVRELARDAPETAIVITTMIGDVRFAREALAAGASGYVLKDEADRDLLNAIRCAARGEHFVAPSVISALTAFDRDRDPLTLRELDVLRLIALGHTNAEMAILLEISMRTVETHRAHIHRKLGLATRAELVAYALRRGLLPGDVAPDERLL